MKIVKALPPNYAEISKHFKIGRGVLFTYGDTIYAPFGGNITEDFVLHEGVHCTQQGDDIDGWWRRYFLDDRFRYSQELEACRLQYEFIKGTCGRQMRRKRLRDLAKMLSGQLYKNMVTYAQAFKEIEQ